MKESETSLAVAEGDRLAFLYPYLFRLSGKIPHQAFLQRSMLSLLSGKHRNQEGLVKL